MKNQKINIKNLSLLAIVILIIITVFLYIQNQNNSLEIDEINQQIETISKVDNSVTQEISKTVQEVNTSQEINKETLEELITVPQEYSVSAEEILYPDEHDFGDILGDTVMAAVGTAIKIDALPIAKAKVGDTIELTFDGKTFNAEVIESVVKYFEAEPGDNAEGTMTYVRFDSRLDIDKKSITRRNQIRGGITYDKNGVVDGYFNINVEGGDYDVKINKSVGYFALTQELNAEFTKQGYKFD
jgi:hypothetical protein